MNIGWDFALAFFFVAVLFIPLVKAEQTIKTVEYPIEYVQSPLADTNYLQTIDLVSPDGISFVRSIEIFVRGDFKANTDITGKIRFPSGALLDCNPIIWETQKAVDNYEASFVCDNIIPSNFEGGSTEFGFRLSKSADNVNGRLKVVYDTKSQGKLDLLGTDYIRGDDATVFLQLLNENDTSINDASCEFDAYFPNKSVFHQDTIMNHLSGSDGLYYYDLTIPNFTGVYMLSSVCFTPSGTFTDDFINFNKVQNNSGVEIVDDKVQLIIPNNSEGSFTNDTFDTSASGNIDVRGITNNGTFIWIVDNGDVSVYKYLLNGTALGEDFDYSTSGSGSPYGITQNETFFWITDDSDNEVYKFFMNGTYTGESFDTDADGLSEPRGITQNDTFFWIVDNGNTEVKIYYMNGTYTGNFFDIFGAGIDSAQGIDTDNEFIWITDNADNEVYKFYMNGTYTGNSFDTSVSGNDNPFGITTNNEFFWIVDDDDELVYTYFRGISVSISGFIDSININLTDNQWNTFSADFDLFEGNITFEIRNSTGSVLCNGLGDISVCAGNTSPIVAFANFTLQANFTNSPTLDRWVISSSSSQSVDEIRGGGEFNVLSWVNSDGSVNAGVNLSGIAQAVWSYNGTIVNNILDQISTNVWNFVNRTLTFFDFITPTDIWNFENRTLTSNTSIVFIGNTEYNIGDDGTIALRLLEGDQDEQTGITGATCNVDILYPNKTLFLDDSNMTEYGEGVYYQDFTVPSPNGVYIYHTNCAEQGSTFKALNTFHVGLVDGISIVNVTNTTVISQIVNVTNQSVNVNDVTVNLTNTSIISQTINVTNVSVNTQLLNITNITTIVNITNATINATDIANAVWNYNGTINSNIINQFVTEIECVINKVLGGEEGWGVNLVSC